MNEPYFFPAFHESDAFFDNQRFLADALELTSAKQLDSLMSNNECAIVYFYKPTCPYCIEFTPVYRKLAEDIHRSNGYKSSTPIVVTKINGYALKEDINALREGFLGDPINRRGFPTLLFKRSDNIGYVWDSNVKRSEYNLCNFMSEFFNDGTLKCVDEELETTMNNPNPEWLIFYSNSSCVVPRFVKPLDPSFTNKNDGNLTMVAYCLNNNTLKNKSAAIPINMYNRPDISTPTVYDVKMNIEYELENAHAWALNNP